MKCGVKWILWSFWSPSNLINGWWVNGCGSTSSINKVVSLIAQEEQQRSIHNFSPMLTLGLSSSHKAAAVSKSSPQGSSDPNK